MIRNWPFGRSVASAIPWKVFSVSDGCQTIRLAAGKWFVTDGGHIDRSDVILIRDFDDCDVEVNISRCDDDLARVRLKFLNIDFGNTRNTEIVIDSGYLVLACYEVFIQQQVTGRGAASRIHKLICPAHQSHVVVELRNTDDACVGLVIVPPFGDGAYALKFETQDGDSTLEIEVLNSL